MLTPSPQEMLSVSTSLFGYAYVFSKFAKPVFGLVLHLDSSVNYFQNAIYVLLSFEKNVFFYSITFSLC